MLFLQHLYQIHPAFPSLEPALVCTGDQVGVGIHVGCRILVFQCDGGGMIFFIVGWHLVDDLETGIVEVSTVELASGCFEREVHFGEGDHGRELFDLGSAACGLSGGNGSKIDLPVRPFQWYGISFRMLMIRP